MAKVAKIPEKKKKGKRSEGSELSSSQLGEQESDSADSQALTEKQLAAQMLEKKQLEELVGPIFDPGVDELPALPKLKPDYDKAGKAIYLETCAELNLVPVSYYLRHCEEPYLNLGHRGLGSVGVGAICKALTTNLHVHTLNLRDNWMGLEGMESVAHLLQISIISDLDLAQNNLGSAGAKIIGDVLYSNPPNLKRLNIARNNFLDADAVHIAYGLDGNDRLVSIDLSHNEFGIQAGKIFSNQVANTTLEKVDLSWNNLRGAGAIALATATKVTSINHLNLAWNGFGEEGAVIIGRSIPLNTALQFLDLTSNRIGVNGAMAIGKALEKNETLITLKMSKNPLTYEGALALIRGVSKCLIPSMKLMELKDVAVDREFDQLYIQLKVTRDIKIVYSCDERHTEEIPLKTRRETTHDELFKRVKAIAAASGYKIYQIMEMLEPDVISAIDFRNWLEQTTRGVIPRVVCDELAICLSMDGNIYKSEILEMFQPTPLPEVVE